jgi:hypothetical protein
MSGSLATGLWGNQRRNLFASSETGYGDTFVRDQVLLVRIQSASVLGGFRCSNQVRLVKNEESITTLQTQFTLLKAKTDLEKRWVGIMENPELNQLR